MRPASILGLLLLIVGGYFLIAGGAITTKKEVVDLGPLEVSSEKKHPIQPWMAGIAVVGGIALLVAGTRRRA